MKHFLFGLPLGLLAAAPVFGQQLEYSVRAHATWSQYAGSSAVANTTILDANNAASVQSTRAANSFGSNMGWLGGLDVRATYVAKFKLLGTFGLGYEGYNTRSDVTGISYYSTTTGTYINSSSGQPFTATGIVHSYTQAAQAFAQVGYRLGGGEHTVAIDVLAGPELSYLTTAYELGEGSGSRGSWKSDLSRNSNIENRLGFGLRGDLIFWVKNVGLTGSYSYGFTNHMPTPTGSTTAPDAELRIIRAGLAYRFSR